MGAALDGGSGRRRAKQSQLGGAARWGLGPGRVRRTQLAEARIGGKCVFDKELWWKSGFLRRENEPNVRRRRAFGRGMGCPGVAKVAAGVYH